MKAETQQTQHSIVLLTGRYVEINLLPLQFTEYNDFIHLKSPNLSNDDTLANFIHYGGIPEYVKQLQIGEKQADMFADSILKTIVEKDIFQRLNITNNPLICQTAVIL